MAEAIAKVSYERYKKNMYTYSNGLVPLYLNKSGAEQRAKLGIEERLMILEMGPLDLEQIEKNYDKFPNLWKTINILEEDTKESKYLIAKREDQVLGFISFKTILDEIEIVNIVTRIDKRNEGIASELLSFIIRNYKDAKKINLEVDEKNETAINLYKKFGFLEVCQRKEYYQNGDNAILMSL